MRDHSEIQELFQNLHKKHIIPTLLQPALEHLVEAHRHASRADPDSELITGFENLIRQTVVSLGVDPIAVSQEGFGDLILKVYNAVSGRDNHGVKAKDTKPGSKLLQDAKWYTNESRAAKTHLVDSIKRFYLNPTWIDKQELVVGNIPSKDFSGVFSIDGNPPSDPFTNIVAGVAKANTLVDKWSAYLAPLDQKMQAIDKATKERVAAIKEDRDALKTCMTDALVEMRKISDKIPKGPLGTGTLLNGYALQINAKWGNVELVKKSPVSVDELPALDKDGIRKAAELIIQCIDRTLFKRIEGLAWLDHSDGDEFNDIVQDNAENEFFEYYKLGYHQGVWDMYEGVIYIPYLIGFDLAFALEKWIDRSIK